MRLLILSVAATALASCAASRPLTLSDQALPTEAEVHRYVQNHWSDWNRRFASLAGRKGEAVALVSLGPVSCSYLYVTPQCEVQVTGQFASGQNMTLTMYSQFEHDTSGNLIEVLVMYHERRR